MHSEQTYKGLIQGNPVHSAPQNVHNSFSVVRDRIVVSDGRSTVISKHEDLEVDHADSHT